MVVATLLATNATAHAQARERKMLVLIDASGSMNAVRADGRTRFTAAKERSVDQITRQARLGVDSVAVYTFSGTTTVPRTVGAVDAFVDAGTAIAVINNMVLGQVGGGTTPLAGAMCAVIDILKAATGPNGFQILQLASDGEENSTPPGNKCQGPTSTEADPPFSTGSWQNKIFLEVQAAQVQVQIDLFEPERIVGLAPSAVAAMDLDARATAALAATNADQLTAGPPTLAAFFTAIAVASGGRLTVVTDQQQRLPVFADFTGNSCTDRSDAILVARAFGQTGDPQDNPLDLDLDGKVGFSDYDIARQSFTAGGCGVTEPFAGRQPLVCSSSRPLTIDGQVIEDGGITIQTQNICRINIRNSLIVSGQNAISILGSAIVTVDNSIIVGETAVLAIDGSLGLSAANSVFHGPRTTRGSFVFTDRGGNTFE